MEEGTSHVQSKDPEEEIDRLKYELAALQQERDAALEMWNLAEDFMKKGRIGLTQSERNAEMEILSKKFRAMQEDYTEAINLLGMKYDNLHKEFLKVQQERDESKQELVALKMKLATDDQIQREMLEKIEKISGERDAYQEALERCHRRLDEALRAEIEAREKVAEAVDALQDCLRNQEILQVTNEQLEETISKLINEAGLRVETEVGEMRKQMQQKVEGLYGQLTAISAEKHRLELEMEAVRTEQKMSIEILKAKNDSLNKELQEKNERWQNASTLSNNEREVLQKQVVCLQTALDSLHASSDGQMNTITTCNKCNNLNTLMETYKSLMEKWKDTAVKVADEYGAFQKYCEEKHCDKRKTSRTASV